MVAECWRSMDANFVSFFCSCVAPPLRRKTCYMLRFSYFMICQGFGLTPSGKTCTDDFDALEAAVYILRTLDEIVLICSDNPRCWKVARGTGLVRRSKLSKHCTVKIPRDSLVWRIFRPALRCTSHHFSYKRHIDIFFATSSLQFQVSRLIKWETKQGVSKLSTSFATNPEWTSLKNIIQIWTTYRYQPRAALSRQQFLHSPNGTLSASFSRIGTWFGCVGELWEEFPWSFSCIIGSQWLRKLEDGTNEHKVRW